MYTRGPWLDRLMHVAVYGVVVAMPFSVLYPLSEPLGPDAVELYVTAGLEPADIPAAVLLVLAAVERCLIWRRGAHARGRASICAGLVALIAVLGVAGIYGAEAPPLAAFTSLRWLLAAAVLWAIVQARVSPQRLAYVLGLGLAVHSLIALLQVWYAVPLGLPGELTLAPGEHSASVVSLGDGRWLRGYGLTFHPNVLGGYLAVGLVLLLPLWSSRTARFLCYVLLVGLAATLSRSAALGLMLAAPPLVWWLWRTDPEARQRLRRAAIVVTSVVLVAGAVFLKPITVRLNPLLVELGVASGEPVPAEQRSLLGRRQMNELAVEVMVKNPFLGIGAGNFPVAMEKARTFLKPQHVHNVPLLLGAEVGVGGLMTWLALAVWTGYALARAAPNRWTVAAASAWAVLFIIGFFDCYPWSLNAGRLLTVTVLALFESSATTSR